MMEGLRAQTVERDGEISCSVEETNRLRKLLGLKPLRGTTQQQQEQQQHGGRAANDGGTTEDGADAGADEPFGRALVTESNGEISCSIEETNRIRASLGLKPLRVASAQPKDTRKEKAIARENAAAEARRNDVQDRIAHAQKQRKLRAKLEGKTLGDETARDGESAADWLARSSLMLAGTKTKPLKSSASKRKVKQHTPASSERGGASADDSELAGVRVAHDLADLAAQGDGVVLTLRDSGVIDAASGQLASEPDELEDHRLAAQKRVAEAHEKIRRRKGEPSLSGIENKPTGILAKYDDVNPAADEGRPSALENRSAAPTILGSGGQLKAVAVKREHNDDPEDLDAAVAARLREVKEQQAGFAVFQQMQDYYTMEEYADLAAMSRKKSKKDKKSKKKKDKKEKKEKKLKKRDKESKRDAKHEDDATPAPTPASGPAQTGQEAQDSNGDQDDATLILRRREKRPRRIVENDGEPADVSSSGPLRLPTELGQRPLEDNSFRPDEIAARIARERGAAGTSTQATSDTMTADPENEGLVLSSTAEFASRIEAQTADRRQKIGEERGPAVGTETSSSKRDRSPSGELDPESNGRKRNKAEISLPRTHNILGDDAFGADGDAGPQGHASRSAGGRTESGLTSALSKLRARGDLDPGKHASNNIIIGRANDAKPIVDDGIGPKLEYRDEHGHLMSQKEAWRAMNRDFHGQKANFKKVAKRQREIDRQVRMSKAAEAQTSTAALKKHQESTGQAFLKLD